MGTLFADPRLEALYRRLFDTPERRALLAELLRAMLDEGATPGPLAGWDGRTVGRGERFTPAQMEARRWWSDPALVWPASATASSTYGSGWAPSSVVGPPTVFPQHGDVRGAWAPKQSSGGVQWLELTFPDDAPPAVGLHVFETCEPGAVFAITDEGAAGGSVTLWQAAPAPEGVEARVLDVTLDGPRALRRVRLWLDTDVGSSWNEIDTVALVAAQPVQQGDIDWRRPRKAKGRKAPARPELPAPDPRGAPTGEGERLDADAAKTLLREASPSWRWPVQARASSTYGGGWSPDAVVGPPTVFPRHGDIQGAWAPASVGTGPQWLEVSFEGSASPVASVLVFETHRPGALYAVVAVDADGRTETLWQRPPVALAHKAVALSVRLTEPRPIVSLRLWVDTDAVDAWPEIDTVALVPPRVTRETCMA